MSVMCVSICMCGFPVRLRVERREVGWGGRGRMCARVYMCVCVCGVRGWLPACLCVRLVY